MKKYITITIILLIIIVGFVYHKKEKLEPAENTAQKESITGCYVATLQKDVYTLQVASQNGTEIGGSLNFNNFEKDSSHGSLEGTYVDGLLRGTYTFESEGTTSAMEVIFKKTEDGFVEGFKTEGATTDITYDNSPEFKEIPCK